MARQIEHGSVLSQEDYDYLEARCRIDEALNVWGCTLDEGVGGEDVRAVHPEPVHPEQAAFIEGLESAPQDPEEGSDESSDEIPPYDEWKVADLESEISRRNEDRDPEGEAYIKPDSGRKADLVAALELDDEIDGE